MPVPVATAGGFRGEYGADPPELVLASDVLPKSLVMGLLVVLLAVWARERLRSGGR